jgi:hypothetical protein
VIIMATKSAYIDATDNPSLSELAREVRASNTPRVIRVGDEDIAVIAPIRGRRARRPLTEADRQAFLSSLGGWKDLVDTDKLIRDIYESRRMSTRPPIEL